MSLRYILLMQRDVAAGARYYNEGLGLPIRVLTERWAELQSGVTTIALQAAPGEAYCTTGFSPVLTFDVEDLQHTLTKLLSLGGRMDGKVHHSVHGKVASICGPDGHMISLVEGADE